MKISASFQIILLVILTCFTYGLFAKRYNLFPLNLFESTAGRTPEQVTVKEGHIRKNGGMWHPRRNVDAEEEPDALEKLRSLPYVTGSHAPSDKSGVTVFDRARTAGEYNLYSSAHGPQALIMDMDGRVLHQWEHDRNDVWPHLAKADADKARHYFRRIHLLENGDLLAIFEYTGIIRINANSELIWAHQGWNHHDLFVDEQGKIYVLGRDVDETGRYSLEKNKTPPSPKKIAGRRVFDDNITILTPAGQVINKISIIECIRRSPFAYLLEAARHLPVQNPLDLLHTNTVTVFDGSHAHYTSVYKENNILVSFRNLSTIAIIDPGVAQVVWISPSQWKLQHEPVLLANGRMLVFDNFAREQNTRGEMRSSRVVEFDPFTNKIFWEYKGTESMPFFSSLMGSNQRLINGNTLITESDYGRVFELTPDKKIVWEFNNPHTSGENNEYVAVIPELIRLSPEFPVENFTQDAKKKNSAR